ncbi:MAG: hypothetical protein QM676_15520 [Novosphingobium sp.]
MLLEEIFGLEVPVGVIINPAGDLRLVADYIEAARSAKSARASRRSRGGQHHRPCQRPQAVEVHRSGLLAAAPTCPGRPMR